MSKVHLYARFQRFSHWIQVLVIFTLLVSGLEVHGLFGLFGYQEAFNVHNFLGWALLAFVFLAFFWYITTGDFKQYLSEGNIAEMVRRQMRYYLVGMFRNEPHPFRKNEISRLNPLQRVIYLALTLVALPAQITVGFVYYFYDNLVALGMSPTWLGPIAWLHTFLAYLLIAFVIMHVYMTTTGMTLTSNIRAMITGWGDEE
jgi:thiosulfate reductase cytochrome b subunit